MDQYKDMYQEKQAHDTMVKLSSLLTKDELNTLNSIEKPSSVVDLNNLLISTMVTILYERQFKKSVKCVD